MIDPTVRAGAAADLDQLVELEREARRAVVGQRGGDRWLATHDERGARWAAAVADDSVLVAHMDDVVVGYLVLEMGGTIAKVDEVWVTPAARELGFGDELLAAAVAAARRSGARVLEGETLPGDRETKNLYERAGIKARLITVSTEIQPDPSSG